MKRIEPKLAKAGDKWIAAWLAMPASEREVLELQLGPDVPSLNADQLITISYLVCAKLKHLPKNPWLHPAQPSCA